VNESEARARFAAARVARLATADAAGRPHLVPLVFVLLGETVYSAVDQKPKQSKALRRLANVRANPQVSLLVDQYDDDWATLWWVRADGTGRVLDPGDLEAVRAVAALATRYPQYADDPPDGAVLAVDVHRFRGWSA
jgi:PPOX class probable F420-dependent enzyme